MITINAGTENEPVEIIFGFCCDQCVQKRITIYTKEKCIGMHYLSKEEINKIKKYTEEKFK